MNDFHILSICIQNKDRVGAMRILRGKSEFAVRKILEKINVRVTSDTGRDFWLWVQNWITSACRRENISGESVRTTPGTTKTNTLSGKSESRHAGFNQSDCATGHVCRSRQYPLSRTPRSASVCAWPDGLPPVHAYLGDERSTIPISSPEKSK